MDPHRTKSRWRRRSWLSLGALAVIAACDDAPAQKESGIGAGAGGMSQAGGGAGVAAGGGVGGNVAAGVGGTTAGQMSTAGAGGVAGTLGGASGAVSAGEGGMTGGSGGMNDDAGGPPIEEPCTLDLEPMPGDDECTAPLKPGDDRLCEFSYGGAMRRYFIYAPPSYNPCKPASLVMGPSTDSRSARRSGALVLKMLTPSDCIRGCWQSRSKTQWISDGAN